MSTPFVKRLAGRCLFDLARSFPIAKPVLKKWGLRTRKEWFGNRTVEVQMPDGRAFRLASLSQNHLSFELFWKGTGYYEPITTMVARELVSAGDTFLDVGANIGFYSLVLSIATPGLSVVAFEPNPKNFALLQRNVAASRLRNVRCEPVAVSDRDGQATLFLSESDMSASLRADFEDHRIGSLPVETLTVDTFVKRNGVRGRVVIKVDVEGHEAAFFRGAVETIRTQAPDIITEVTVEYDRDVIDFFKENGYHFYQITDQGLHEAAAIGPVVRGQVVFLNYLVSRKSQPEIDAHFERIADRVRRLDLTQTSKYLTPEAVAHFVARMAQPRAAHVPSAVKLAEREGFEPSVGI